MNPQKRKYYVVIVHFGSEKLTQRALSSLYLYPDAPDGVVVIDNAKQPAQSLQGQYPAVTVLRPEQNRGFGAGVNLGLGVLLARKVQETDIVVVMNNDVVVEPTTFSALRAWWDKESEEALLGVVTAEEHGRIHGLGYVDLLTGRTTFQRPRAYYLPYIHGSFFAAPFATLLKVHGVPEKYFLYWEDALLGLRATQYNIPLRVSEDITVQHHHASSSAPTGDQLYYLVRNGAIFLERETPPGWRQAWWLRNRLRGVYHNLRPGRHSTVRQALRDARRHVLGKRQAV